jgi:hypothetical protein
MLIGEPVEVAPGHGAPVLDGACGLRGRVIKPGAAGSGGLLAVTLPPGGLAKFLRCTAGKRWPVLIVARRRLTLSRKRGCGGTRSVPVDGGEKLASGHLFGSPD